LGLKVGGDGGLGIDGYRTFVDGGAMAGRLAADDASGAGFGAPEPGLG
jgi:hypothetical protein